MRRIAVRWVLLTLAAACPLVLSAPAPAQQVAEARVDREYVLEAAMLGYRGVGGDIDGVRNPVLRATAGERVRITIVGVEVLPHDIALEQMGIRSAEVVDVGDRTSITFVAEHDDVYYCTIPGHRVAGMVGTFEIVEAGSTLAADA